MKHEFEQIPFMIFEIVHFDILDMYFDMDALQLEYVNLIIKCRF